MATRVVTRPVTGLQRQEISGRFSLTPLSRFRNSLQDAAYGREPHESGMQRKFKLFTKSEKSQYLFASKMIEAALESTADINDIKCNGF
jgi:hypothetical protein